MARAYSNLFGKTMMTFHKILAAVMLTALGMIPTHDASAITVHDPVNNSVLADQLNKANKTIEQLQEQKQILQDQISAIGRAGQITLPNLNLDKITSSVRNTVSCTLLNEDDLKRMLPGIAFEDVNIASVCMGRQLYENALFGNLANQEKLSHSEQTQSNLQVSERRRNLQRDAAIKSIAMSDEVVKKSENLSEAITQLEIDASAAKDQNARLAVIAKGVAIVARAINQGNLIQALILRNTSLEMVVQYLPTSAMPSTETTPNGDGS